jgi:hypothetical protein
MQLDRVLSIIDTIERGRREAKIEPVCAPFIEILNKCTPEQRKTVRNDLNKLYLEGKIKVWKGINDLIVQTI